MSMKVLITGATGLIGKEVGKALVRAGFEVFALSRNAARAELELPYPAQVIEGDLTHHPLDPSVLQNIEAVIHLAGENVGEGRWTEERKKKIVSSRVDFTKNLIQSLPPDLKVFISSSAVGIYGDRGSEKLTEKSSAGKGFLADVCVSWEAAAQDGKKKFPSARTVIFRTGVVLAPYGGALLKMLPPFQMGIGGVLGSGQQWMSWIHLQDLVGLYVEALQNTSYQGIYNAVSPEPITNREFTKILCHSLNVHSGLPVPALALKALYGEMSRVAFDSERVHSDRLASFTYRFPSLSKALSDCCAPYRDGDQVFLAEQYFPLPVEKVFPFFAKAENLESITPPLLNFQVQSVSTPDIQRGTLIEYRLKVHGVPMGWRTLIDDWKPNEMFVDTQLKGPYKKWHHTHSFEKLGSGTLMRDVVRYQLPVGKLGQIFGGSFVRGDVEKIFSYRRQAVPSLLRGN
jgi:hypothetical protein